MRKHDPNIDKALEYLYNNVDRPMSLQEIANVCGCNEANIRKIFYNAMAKVCKDEGMGDIKSIWDDLKADEH